MTYAFCVLIGTCWVCEIVTAAGDAATMMKASGTVSRRAPPCILQRRSRSRKVRKLLLVRCLFSVSMLVGYEKRLTLRSEMKRTRSADWGAVPAAAAACGRRQRGCRQPLAP